MSTFLDQSIDLYPDEQTLTETGILVVDEDPAFQLGLKTFLKEYVGFERVFTARNGKEAIDLIEREPSIELLTVDYQMPEMDGLELLSHLQEDTPRPLGVTMITGFPSEDLKREFASRTSSKLLTNHFLSKPVEFEKLEPIILDCYEELKRSQQLTQTMTGGFDEVQTDINAIALAESNRELIAKFDGLDEKLDANTNAIKALKRSSAMRAFWSDLLKLIIIGALAAYAWKAGWIEKGWEKLKNIPIVSGNGDSEADSNINEVQINGETGLPKADMQPGEVTPPAPTPPSRRSLPTAPPLPELDN